MPLSNCRCLILTRPPEGVDLTTDEGRMAVAMTGNLGHHYVARTVRPYFNYLPQECSHNVRYGSARVLSLDQVPLDTFNPQVVAGPGKRWMRFNMRSYLCTHALTDQAVREYRDQVRAWLSQYPDHVAIVLNCLGFTLSEE